MGGLVLSRCPDPALVVSPRRGRRQRRLTGHARYYYYYHDYHHGYYYHDYYDYPSTWTKIQSWYASQVNLVNNAAALFQVTNHGFN